MFNKLSKMIEHFNYTESSSAKQSFKKLENLSTRIEIK